MKSCYYCKGTVLEKRIRHVHPWGGRIYVLEGVPAEVCQQCGEVYFAPDLLPEMDRIVAGHQLPTSTIPVPVYTFS
ncbi:MAG: type II toxin-antitoxin system MqsA family antitoxin [Chloroflexi bacterium]|nr:type II toxin-antitoxin system MqsA family antitoxin [Chloroflexota bacterium]